MKCPYCPHKETKVIDSRESKDLLTTWRRRECLKCKKRFTTYERIETLDIIVIKKNNDREQFDRSKIEKGILKACEKRPVSYDLIKKIVDDIEAELRGRKTTEVKSSIIGDLIIKKLKKIDKVAYIRFASVYREFADITSFQQELKGLLKKRK